MIDVTLLGSGGATPYLQRTTPMVLVSSERDLILFDCGSGATQRLAQSGMRIGKLGSLFFTHFHADHCVDFPITVLTSYLAGRDKPLEVFGPAGTFGFVNLMLDNLYSYIPGLISNVVGEKFEIKVVEVSPGQRLEMQDVVISVGEAKHGGVPALCYRVDSTTESLTYSGDTEYAHEIIDLARKSDLLIHECPFPPHFGATPGHTSPSQVGEIANRANVGSVAIVHLFEEVLGYEDEIKKEIGKAFHGDIFIGEDLMTLRLDRGSVSVSKLGRL